MRLVTANPTHTWGYDMSLLKHWSGPSMADIWLSFFSGGGWGFSHNNAFSSSLPALPVPVWPGEGRGGALPPRRPDVVSGGAQEPGLLRLHQASHPHRRRTHAPRFVSAAFWFVGQVTPMFSLCCLYFGVNYLFFTAPKMLHCSADCSVWGLSVIFYSVFIFRV